ncbi:hypothetical protein, partial [Moorena sp. SIO1F2]|uniref:hypothetical protein n=1 Tax=Moorena sp. SIO1F2 TaxID=2607819 RepID=UPI0025FE3683
REFTRLSLFLLGLGLANCTQTPNQPSPNGNLSSEDAQLRIWWPACIGSPDIEPEQSRTR